MKGSLIHYYLVKLLSFVIGAYVRAVVLFLPGQYVIKLCTLEIRQEFQLNHEVSKHQKYEALGTRWRIWKKQD